MITPKRKYYSIIGLQFQNQLFTPSFIDTDARANYNRIIADGGVSDINRLNYFIRGLKDIYGSLTNVPVCYDAYYIGYKTGAGAGPTLGQAIAKLYSLTVGGDLIQNTATAQPLLLAHNGTDNYFYTGPGNDTVGNFCQTSTNVSPQINTDFTFEFNFSNYISRGIFGGCPTASAAGWSLQIQSSTNVLRFYGRVASINVLTVDSTTGITVTGNRWIKVVRSGNDYSFWEKADGGTYTQVGTTVTDATVLTSISQPIQIGNGFNTNYIGIGCNINKANFYSDATSTNLVSTFNPNSYNGATSQTQWTSSTSEVWTINTGSASTGYKGSLVDRTQIQSDGIDDKLSTLGVTLNDGHFNYCVYKGMYEDGSGNRMVYSNGTNNFNNAIAMLSTNNMFISLTNAIFGGSVTKTIRTLGLSTSVFGTNITKGKVNNGTFGSTLAGTYVGGAGYTLFANPSVHFGNSLITTNIISQNTDTLDQQTAMYNLIKTMNNNAF
jgi:hypothetical protein